MTETVVEVGKVTFFRKQRTILSEVSWQIKKGQHWALLGANGSGKTTLLKLICGYDWPTFGSVRVLGKRFGACDVRQLRKLIGWVSSAMCQNLPGQDTAAEVVVSGLEASVGLYREFSDAELNKAQEILAHLGAETIAGQRYHTLSQGEQQKVLVARALINEPKLLILDEPCIGLDPMARERFGDPSHRRNPALGTAGADAQRRQGAGAGPSRRGPLRDDVGRAVRQSV
jgi:iron complex transport system ATP-binding protein